MSRKQDLCSFERVAVPCGEVKGDGREQNKQLRGIKSRSKQMEKRYRVSNEGRG